MSRHNTNAMKGRRVAAAENEAYDKIARALLTKEGFDLEDVNKKCNINGFSLTPMIHFSRAGNLQMCRYLLSRGADCRKNDLQGGCPMYWAACRGLLEIVRFLSHDGGAQEDIRKDTRRGLSPLWVALGNVHFEVVYWLLLNGALAPPRYDVDGGGIDDAIMRRDLRQIRIWNGDRRSTVLSWAHDAVATHENVVQLLVTGTIVRSNNQELSLLVMFNGTSGILELISHFVAGTQHQLRSRRQLMDCLSTFIDDTPFVEEDDLDDETEEDWDDEEDY